MKGSRNVSCPAVPQKASRAAGHTEREREREGQPDTENFKTPYYIVHGFGPESENFDFGKK